MNSLIVAIIVGIGLLFFWVGMKRVLIRLRARRKLETFFKNNSKQDIRAPILYALEDPKCGILTGDTDCLMARSARGAWELPWDEVDEVHAFKRDLGTTDLICLAFKKAGKEEHYEIHEEMAGYHDLLFEVLPNRLPGYNMEWFLKIVAPAFETTYTVIWKREPDKPA